MPVCSLNGSFGPVGIPETRKYIILFSALLTFEYKRFDVAGVLCGMMVVFLWRKSDY